jgi:hypothetical protein
LKAQHWAAAPNGVAALYGLGAAHFIRLGNKRGIDHGAIPSVLTHRPFVWLE